MKTFIIFLAIVLALVASLNNGQAASPELPSFSSAFLLLVPPSPSTDTPSSGATNKEIVDLWSRLTEAVTAQQETEALDLAMKLLHAVPIQDSIKPVTQNGVTSSYNYIQQREAALKALKAFNAIDEYERKVKAYYKEDANNLIYNKLMAECLLVQNPSAATPFLEQAYKLAPDDPIVAGNLARRYSAEKNDPALLALLDSILEKNMAIPTGAPINVVGVYTRSNQLSHLTQLYANILKESPHSPFINGAGDSLLGQNLERTLIQLNRKDDLIVLYRACVEANDLPQLNSKMKLRELVMDTSDKGVVEEQCENAFFPSKPNVQTSPSPRIILQGVEIIPNSPLFDVVRIAKQSGNIDQMKKRAESDFDLEQQKLGGAEDRLMIVLVFSHDPDALVRLPAYLKDIVADTKTYSGRPPYSLNYNLIYGIFGELLQWPEAKDLLKPTLQAAFDVESLSQPERLEEIAQRVAKLALKINDKDMAQNVLRDTLIKRGIIASPSGTLLPPPPTHDRPPYVLGELAGLARQLINAGMPTELQAVIPLLADASKSQQDRFPESRTEIIASLGEAAFDAGDTSTAKLCAATALRQLKSAWQDPNQTSDGNYTVTINANAVHFTCDLLLRLGLNDQFDDLQTLLSQPSTVSSLDRNTMLADVNRLRLMLGNSPHGLTPALWLTATTDGNLTRKVAWDVTARSGNSNSGNCNLFSVQARALPQIDGKFDLQILAGSTQDDLRVLQTIKAATARGTTDLTLQSDDRFIRAICQTSEAQPRVFVGPIVPISLGANLLPESCQTRLYSFAIFNSPPDDHPVPMTTNQSARIDSNPGGPTSGAMFKTVSCPDHYACLELIGPQQKIAPKTIYCQSGWLKGDGEWGIRYLDEKGNKISESSISYQNSSNDWEFVEHIFQTTNENRTSHEQVPSNAVAFETFLRLSQIATVSWQDLYLGIVQQIKPDYPTPIMEGLQGVTSIEESPQGGILAAAFENGDVRCFDLKTHLEIGSAGKLPAKAVDVTFINQGKDVVAADVTGNILTRSVQDNTAGRIVYHAPWPIDYLSASSDSSIAAIADRSKGKIVVVDLTTGQEISQIQLAVFPLVTMVISPDGKNLYCSYAYQSGIWDTRTGKPLSLIISPFTSDPNLPPVVIQNDSYGGMARVLIDEVAMAHFFKIQHILKTSEQQKPCWVQAQSGFFVMAMDSSLIYGMKQTHQVFQQFDTGQPIAAFCLSTQNNDVYTIGAKGALTVWRLPDSVKLPSLPVVAKIKVNPSPPPATLPAVPSLQLIIEAPKHLRGFPKTTLSQVLTLTILKSNQDPVVNAQLEIKSDLNGTSFGDSKAQNPSDFHSSLKVQTDQDGKATVLVHLGEKPGLGKIMVTASSDNLTKKQEISLEAIDETALLKPTHDVFTNAEGGRMFVSWNEEADNRTGFIIQRKVDNGPVRTIAIVPENSTSYIDNDVTYQHFYSYGVTSTNDSKYGYPATLPPPPDRLGNFQP